MLTMYIFMILFTTNVQILMSISRTAIIMINQLNVPLREAIAFHYLTQAM